MNAKCKKTYVSPVILRQTSLAPRMELLAGSVETMTVTSTGQEVENYGTAAQGFNHEWN